MDSYMTISEVSRHYQISTRMLRHYEKLGLIESTHRADYSYRVYDEGAVQRVRQIILLRKLQIPLKKIRRMMEGTSEDAVRILQERLRDMDESLESAQAMRAALSALLELLQNGAYAETPMDTLNEPAVAELVQLLPMEKHRLKERKTVSETKQMIEKENCIRIVLLPPFTVAAYQYIGESPESHVGDVMDPFIRSSGLYEKKPDARYFGFNHPDPEEGSSVYGYEVWVTIPEDMEVPAPLVKKHFPGGLYAAYTINFPDFFEWQFLGAWAEANEKYEPAYADPAEKNMRGGLEEHLNWVYSAHMGWPEDGIDGKLDLLLPIRPRKR